MEREGKKARERKARRGEEEGREGRETLLLSLSSHPIYSRN